ncbi:putative ribonuclease H-like domain-containing protein [Tanacetum coccineum]
MSPSKRKFRWGIMRSTGIKRYIDPISGCKIWRTNRKCRIPINFYPCKVVESMTMKKVGDQTIGVIRRRRIDKEGNVSIEKIQVSDGLGHMTGNKSYLSDYEEINGGFVAFGGDPKGGKITGKDTECVVLSPDFKLLDENQYWLRVPRKYNMYSVDLRNIVPSGGLTCLFAKATLDESNLWHRRLEHINFKTINKLVRGNLVRGLPSKLFEINQTCVACQKGKQHKASCKIKTVSLISQPLQMLHMDLFGPTFVKSLMKKMYCLVVTDDFSRFSWVFFLATKDETSEILKTFIIDIENLIDLRVKVIRCDNGTEFKNRFMNQFCEMKGIKGEFSVARTPQQNRRKHALSFMRPFGFPIIILNTIDHLGKFDGKADEGFFVGYSTNSKAFRQVVAGNQSNSNAGTKACNNAGKARMETDSPNAGFKPSEEEEKMDTEDPGNENAASGKDSEVPSTEEPREDQRVNQELDASINSTNNINIASDGNSTNNVNDVVTEVNVVDPKTSIKLSNDPNMPELEDIVYSDDDEDDGAEADMNNLDAFMPVSPIPTTRIHKDHPVEQIIRDLNSEPQTRRMTKNLKEHGLFSSVQQRTNHKDFQNCLFTCFLSQEEPKKWIYQMEKGILALNGSLEIRRMKEELIEAIRLFLAYASFKDFVVYQMDVKSAFLCGVPEEIYVCQTPGFEDLDFPDRMSSMGELTFFLGLQVKQKDDGIFISQDKYVADILKRFDFAIVKTASTPIETNKALLKDEEAEDVDVHLYRSMIGSLMYLTASRPDIMFAVCACARFQVTPKVSHLHAVKRIFRYLKGQPKLGLWLISWQCKKQTIVANSTTEAKYVAAANCCGHVVDLLTKAVDVSRFQYLIARCLKWNGIAAKDEIQVSAIRVTYYCGPIPFVADETVIKEWEDRMERAATTASSLEAEQDSGNINRTQSMATLNESFPPRSGIRFEAASKQSNDPPLSRVNTLRSGEDNMKLKELMEFCTKLSVRALDLA